MGMTVPSLRALVRIQYIGNMHRAVAGMQQILYECLALVRLSPSLSLPGITSSLKVYLCHSWEGKENEQGFRRRGSGLS